MPTRVRGKNVEHYKNGKWSVKQHCSSHENAVKAKRAIDASEHGWKPTKKSRKK